MTDTTNEVQAARAAWHAIMVDPDGGLTRRLQRQQGGHTLATASKIYGSTVRNGVNSFERPGRYQPRKLSIVRYYISINREDLADVLLPLLTPLERDMVEAVRKVLHRDGAALRAAQHNQQHAVRADRRKSRRDSADGGQG